MSHLREEVLARLVDDAPVEGEALHLEECADCARELVRLREQTEALHNLARNTPPPPAEEWERLRARLRLEGVIAEGLGAPPAVQTSPSRWLRLAAGILLFLGGAGFGVLVSERGVIGRGEVGVGEFDPQPFALLGALTLDEAEELVRITQEWHIEALLLYRGEIESAGGGMASGDPVSRYLYLDDLLLTAEAAILDSPADPFLNGLFASTVAEREATLREIAMAPTDTQLPNAR